MVTFHMNGEDVQLIPIPVAHTDGDTMVRFVNNDVIMTGDFYRSIQYPNIDRANGGSLNGMIDGLGQVHRALRAQHENHPRPRPDSRPQRRDGASRHDPGDSRSRSEAGGPREVSG